MLNDYDEEQFDIDREHHPCASLLRRFVEWKNLRLEVALDFRYATIVWFSSYNGEKLLESNLYDLAPFYYHFNSVSKNDNEAKNELLRSEFLCKELLCSMAEKHFFMFKNDHSSEFVHDFIFPATWQILDMQMTIAGF